MIFRALVLLLMILIGISVLAQTKEQRAQNEAGAIEVMRLIHAVEITYKEGIGQGAFGSASEIFREDFIDEELANALGVPKMKSLGDAECRGDHRPMNGYLFQLTLTRSAEGKPKFSCLAQPAVNSGDNRTGDRSFYVDDTGVIRYSKDANIPAGAGSETLAD